MDNNTNMGSTAPMGDAPKSSSKSWVAFAIVVVLIIVGWILLSQKTPATNPVSVVTPQNNAALALGTGNWAETAPITTGVINAASAMLSDGRVMVVGGHATNGDTGAAQIYNPATGTWASAGALKYVAENLAATTLSSGKIFVNGGQQVSNHTKVLSSTSIYDPATNKWTAGPNMTQPRMGELSVLLSTGKVLIVGGFSGANSTYCGSGGCSTAELFNPVTNTSTATPNLAYKRNNFTMVYNPSVNKVYVAGGAGITTCSSTGSLEIYDVASNTWSTGAPLNTAAPRYKATSMLLPGGKVMIAGGIGCNGEPLASAEIYDPASNSWTVTNMPGAIQVSNSVGTVRSELLSNGKALVMGESATYLYDPAAGTWATGPSRVNAQMGPQISEMLQNGKVLLLESTWSSAYKSELYTE